jgi:hypothetical protein
VNWSTLTDGSLTGGSETIFDKDDDDRWMSRESSLFDGVLLRLGIDL